MNGVQLALLYAQKTNQLNYCGPVGAYDKIVSYLQGQGSYNEALEILKKFGGLYNYMKLIAEKNELEPTDYAVAEAYLLGNDLLEKVRHQDLKRLVIDQFGKMLPKPVALRIANSIPPGVKAHHSFLVLHVRSVEGRVPMSVLRPDICIISWGIVKKASAGEAVVSRRPLLYEEGDYVFGEPEERLVEYLPSIVKPRKGKRVAMHWDRVAQVISQKQLDVLKKYTLQNIRAVNASVGRFKHA